MPPSSDANDSEPLRVHTVPLETVTFVDSVRAVGTARATRAVDLMPDASGRISRIDFQPGDQFAAGALLLELVAVMSLLAALLFGTRRYCPRRFDRSSYHYKSRRTDQADLKRRIKEIFETRVRYGYRRVYVVLDREGWEVSLGKV